MRLESNMFTRNIIFILGLILFGKGLHVQGQSENDGCGKSVFEITYLQVYLTFPVYMQKFSNKSICLFKVIPTPRYIANMSFDNISIADPNSNCDQGYVQFVAHMDDFSNATKYCGTIVEENIYRTTEPFYVKINMTGMIIPGLVRLKFRQDQIGEPNDGCGNNSVQLNSIRQSVKFPLNDQLFSNKTNCIVKVNPITGYKASTSVENIYIDDVRSFCYKGFFQVAVTKDALSNSTEYCGKKPAGHILDAVETIYIHIELNNVKLNSTFTLGFFSTRIDQPNDGCGDNIVQLNSVMQSVKFPRTDQPFTVKTNCIVKFIPMTGYKTSTFIESIDINDPNSNCDQGYFQAAPTTDSLGNATKHCGTKQIGQILEAFETVYVQINMAGMRQTATFALKFVSTRIGQPNDGCGDNSVQLNSKIQFVKFPLNGQPFSDKTNCVVKVNPMIGYKTYTSIESIEINDPNSNCDQGYFQVGTTTDVLGNATKYCGTKQVGQILETLEALYVQINMTGMKNTATFTLKFVASSTRFLTSRLLAIICFLVHQLVSF